MRERRSIRAYEPGKEISAETIREILAEARWAPSWKNSQTARTYVALSPEKRQQVLSCLPGFNQNSAGNASALLVTTFVCDRAGFTEGKPDNELGNEWGAYDLGLYNACLLLSAKSRGLDSLIMGLRDSAALRAVFAIPENERIAAVIALGYRQGEAVVKPRKPVEEISVIL